MSRMVAQALHPPSAPSPRKRGEGRHREILSPSAEGRRCRRRMRGSSLERRERLMHHQPLKGATMARDPNRPNPDESPNRQDPIERPPSDQQRSQPSERAPKSDGDIETDRSDRGRENESIE